MNNITQPDLYFSASSNFAVEHSLSVEKQNKSNLDFILQKSYNNGYSSDNSLTLDIKIQYSMENSQETSKNIYDIFDTVNSHKKKTHPQRQIQDPHPVIISEFTESTEFFQPVEDSYIADINEPVQDPQEEKKDHLQIPDNQPNQFIISDEPFNILSYPKNDDKKRLIDISDIDNEIIALSEQFSYSNKNAMYSSIHSNFNNMTSTKTGTYTGVPSDQISYPMTNINIKKYINQKKDKVKSDIGDKDAHIDDVKLGYLKFEASGSSYDGKSTSKDVHLSLIKNSNKSKNCPRRLCGKNNKQIKDKQNPMPILTIAQPKTKSHAMQISKKRKTEGNQNLTKSENNFLVNKTSQGPVSTTTAAKNYILENKQKLGGGQACDFSLMKKRVSSRVIDTTNISYMNNRENKSREKLSYRDFETQTNRELLNHKHNDIIKNICFLNRDKSPSLLNKSKSSKAGNRLIDIHSPNILNKNDGIVSSRNYISPMRRGNNNNINYFQYKRSDEKKFVSKTQAKGKSRKTGNLTQDNLYSNSNRNYALNKTMATTTRKPYYKIQNRINSKDVNLQYSPDEHTKKYFEENLGANKNSWDNNKSTEQYFSTKLKKDESLVYPTNCLTNQPKKNNSNDLLSFFLDQSGPDIATSPNVKSKEVSSARINTAGQNLLQNQGSSSRKKACLQLSLKNSNLKYHKSTGKQNSLCKSQIKRCSTADRNSKRNLFYNHSIENFKSNYKPNCLNKTLPYISHNRLGHNTKTEDFSNRKYTSSIWNNNSSHKKRQNQQDFENKLRKDISSIDKRLKVLITKRKKLMDFERNSHPIDTINNDQKHKTSLGNYNSDGSLNITIKSIPEVVSDEAIANNIEEKERETHESYKTQLQDPNHNKNISEVPTLFSPEKLISNNSIPERFINKGSHNQNHNERSGKIEPIDDNRIKIVSIDLKNLTSTCLSNRESVNLRKLKKKKDKEHIVAQQPQIRNSTTLYEKDNKATQRNTTKKSFQDKIQGMSASIHQSLAYNGCNSFFSNYVKDQKLTKPKVDFKTKVDFKKILMAKKSSDRLPQNAKLTKKSKVSVIDREGNSTCGEYQMKSIDFKTNRSSMGNSTLKIPGQDMMDSLSGGHYNTQDVLGYGASLLEKNDAGKFENEDVKKYDWKNLFAKKKIAEIKVMESDDEEDEPEEHLIYKI